jgi:RNA-directed DNA polymerase
MSRGQRQRLCGLVINRRRGVPRAELDNLKALLFNAARFGPGDQNRASRPRFKEHLLGRIAWVASLHPGRGARLRALFDRISWPAE